jgi:hypothetical protein
MSRSLGAQRADLVLEQLAQRLDEDQVQLLRQAADVAVRLERAVRIPARRASLDLVG